MNAAKMTLTAMILAAALGMALGLAAAPALANPPDADGCHNHKLSCDSGDDSASSFSVDVQAPVGSGPEWVVTSDECEGLTTRQGPIDMNAVFPAGCGEVQFNGIDLFHYAIEVRSRKGEVTSVQLFFTSGLEVSPVRSETVYISDKLPAMIGPSPAGSSFAITVNETAEALIKLHQPDKGEVVCCFSIGTFVYTSIP